MIEPVACININKNGTSNLSTSVDAMADEVIPLYTSEQLHPRVKMTNQQRDEFMNIKENMMTFYGFWKCLLDGQSNLLRNIPEHDLMLAWLNLEETIEIAPDMKWFVQKKNFNGDYRFLNTGEKDLSFNHTKDKAACFDTKGEAEKWTNPLTEAVQLPVEDE